MQAWVGVVHGSLAEVEIARSRLEGAGIPCFVPAQNMKTFVPFDTGGQIFDFDLLVPKSALPAARAQLEDVSSEAELQSHEKELPGDFFADEPEVPAASELETCRALSRQIRWGAVSWVGAPFAVAGFWPYVRAVERLGHPPPNHGLTIAGFYVALAQLVVFAWMIATSRT